MPDVITSTEYLIINGTPSATPAWRITHLTPLWASPDVRGTDRIIPGVNGVRPKRRRPTGTRYALPGVVFGNATREGTPVADVRAGLRANFDELYADWLTQPATPEGTVAATWVLPGTDKTADIHVLKLTARDFTPDTVRFTLEISIPAGGFA